MLSRALVVVCVVTTAWGEVAAQIPEITVGPSIRISTLHATDPYFETALAINPRDSRNLIAASMVQHDGKQFVELYASFDGGRTWIQGRAPAGDTDMLRAGDPAICFDGNGTAFFARNGSGGGILSRSLDGGRTWERHGTPPNRDRPWLIADETDGKYHDRIYLAVAAGGPFNLKGKQIKTARLLYSADGGRTFSSEGASVTKAEGDETVRGPGNPLVTPDGTLVVPFVTMNQENTYSDNPFYGIGGHVGVAVSGDGGDTFSLVRLVASIKYGPADLPTTTSMIRAAVDLSAGPFRGRIYLTWVDYDEESKRYLVKITFSSDTGTTWSAPITANDSTTYGGTIPVIAVNKNGVVGVAWNGFRTDDDCYMLFFTASRDGGATFLPSVRASDDLACPRSLGNWKAISAWNRTFGSAEKLPSSAAVQEIELFAAVPRRRAHGEDTQGLVADSAGVFHAAWVNGVSGVLQPWTTPFTVAPQTVLNDTSRIDLTSQVELVIEKAAIDPSDKTLGLWIRLKNRSSRTIVDPVTVVLAYLKAQQFVDVRAKNADNKLPGQGASWKMIFEGEKTLPPEGQSELQELMFSFTGVSKSNLPANIYRSPTWAFKASFIILGPSK